VIHNGIRLPEAAGRGKRLEFPYFLFVGTIEPRKNLGALLEAWTIVKGRRGAAWKHRLLVAGGSGWGCPPAAQQVREKGLGKDVLVLDYVNDDDLASLYAGAEALVYPSLYEGFGIPLVEAMARGTPVIASNAPAIPEVVGDAAFLCDPHDPEGIAGALMRIRDDRALRESMVARGLERATLFTRERTARETLTLYRKLLK
jgi:glycosyltransferase involved in cell wall biosynthesis